VGQVQDPGRLRDPPYPSGWEAVEGNLVSGLGSGRRRHRWAIQSACTRSVRSGKGMEQGTLRLRGPVLGTAGPWAHHKDRRPRAVDSLPTKVRMIMCLHLRAKSSSWTLL